jgi:hypothetical protein
LRVGIADHELAALKAGADHIINGVTASATDANYCYSRGQFLHLFVLHSDVNHGGDSSIGFDLLVILSLFIDFYEVAKLDVLLIYQ